VGRGVGKVRLVEVLGCGLVEVLGCGLVEVPGCGLVEVPGCGLVFGVGVHKTADFVCRGPSCACMSQVFAVLCTPPLAGLR